MSEALADAETGFTGTRPADGVPAKEAAALAGRVARGRRDTLIKQYAYTETRKGVDMASKAFNSARAPADSMTLRQVAADAGRVLPAAMPGRERWKVLINVKVTADLALALAERAETEGGAQNQVITRALAAAKLPVDPSDLEDRTPRRRFVA